MTAHVHIAICGAGPVGQALALMLQQQGYAASGILLLDAKTAEQARADARSIALSYGSQQILRALQAWPIKATTITQIHVSRRAHFGRSLIKAADYQLPALGYVARYGDIVTTLQNLIQQRGIALQRPVQVSALEEQVDLVELTLADGSKITADLVIQAEGGTFSAQQQLPQKAGGRHHDYQQTAVIAHIISDTPIAGRAFERFTDQGPLALLPQEDGYALVWCMRPDNAQTVLALDETAFLSALQTAFGGRLGKFIKASHRHAYPLGLNTQQAEPSSPQARSIKIGNAAQTLHPVAGQGLNLGLRDAVVLAKCLAAQLNTQGHCQSPAMAINDFISRRQSDRTATINITDGMARIFASAPDGALSQSLLGLGLSTLDLIAPAKKMLAEQMMYGWR
ncbi:FAD-dependent monooxygenase [Undibacterium sp. Ren11W]|uniref:FAD-dependent monooxygenase n=1 Tax=Undibacterium sp. Ren11W TaxID=3413045 RepID=UPI003BF2BF31